MPAIRKNFAFLISGMLKQLTQLLQQPIRSHTP